MRNFSVRAESIVLLALLAPVTVPCGSAFGGEGAAKATLAVSEEYNDNVRLSTFNRKEDFITTVAPAVDLMYSSRYSDLGLHAGAEYLHFANHGLGDELNPDVITNDRIGIIGNLLYLKVTDIYKRVPLNYGYQNLFTNQTNQNSLAVSPYLQFTPGRFEITAGYLYNNVIYNRRNAIDWRENGAFLKTGYLLTPKTKCYLDATASATESGGFHTDKLIPFIGLDHEYSEQSHLVLEGGYSLMRIKGDRSFDTPYWTAALNYAFPSTDVSLKGGVLYNTDPQRSLTVENSVEGAVVKHVSRGSLGFRPFYNSTKDCLTHSRARERYGATVDLSWELTAKSRLTLAGTGERDHGTLLILAPGGTLANRNEVPNDFVKATGEAKLNVELVTGLDLFASYAYSTYLYRAGNNGNIHNNRATVGITATFGSRERAVKAE